MRKLIWSINCSLDGYADHTIPGADDELHDFFRHQLEDAGIELFGRVTYEMMASYWPELPKDPSASASDLKFAEKYNSIPKVVFSKTLQKADWNNTTLVKTDAMEHIAELKKIDGKDLYVSGIRLAGSLITAGLVDEYWIVVHPVIAGNGRRLTESFKGEDFVHLKLLGSKTLKSGVVALHYAKK